MNARTTLWIALSVGMGAGCAQVPPPTPVATASARTTAIPTCGGAGTVGTCPDARGACHVEVTLASPGSVPEVKPSEILVDPSAGPLHIVWHLPRGAHFVAAQQDGIFLKNDDQDQFSMNYPTDDATGFPGIGRKGRHYHWHFENSKRSRYQYTLRFRMNSTIYECDPLINNQGGGG